MDITTVGWMLVARGQRLVSICCFYKRLDKSTFTRSESCWVTRHSGLGTYRKLLVVFYAGYMYECDVVTWQKHAFGGAFKFKLLVQNFL